MNQQFVKLNVESVYNEILMIQCFVFIHFFLLYPSSFNWKDFQFFFTVFSWLSITISYAFIKQQYFILEKARKKITNWDVNIFWTLPWRRITFAIGKVAYQKKTRNFSFQEVTLWKPISAKTWKTFFAW